jgi:hypothetical protein
MGLSSLPAAPGISYNRIVFLSSGTFTLPKSAFNKFDCVLVSGGGGGAGAFNNNPRKSFGGSGCAAYFHDIFCSNETTLTVTVGAGGTGGAAVTAGGLGNESTITGLTGNGVSTSLSSGNAKGGTVGSAGGLIGNISPQVARNFTNNGGNYAAKFTAAGWGFGVSAFSSGNREASGYAGGNLNIFGANAVGGVGTIINTYFNSTANNGSAFQRGGKGGPIPLLGSLLHAATGSDGTAGQSAGGVAQANSYFAGTGGGSQYGSSQAGFGGGGGAGGQSNNSSVASGNGGAGSANSGGGGGAGGQNQAGGSLLGVGANGGSGFVVIGYWG